MAEIPGILLYNKLYINAHYCLIVLCWTFLLQCLNELEHCCWRLHWLPAALYAVWTGWLQNTNVSVGHAGMLFGNRLVFRVGLSEQDEKFAIYWQALKHEPHNVILHNSTATSSYLLLNCPRCPQLIYCHTQKGFKWDQPIYAYSYGVNTIAKSYFQVISLCCWVYFATSVFVCYCTALIKDMIILSCELYHVGYILRAEWHGIYT